MNYSRKKTFSTGMPVPAEAEIVPESPEVGAGVSRIVPKTHGGLVGQNRLAAGPHIPACVAGSALPRPQWTRPHRRVEQRYDLLPFQEISIPVPRIPEGMTEEEGTSLGALAVVLTAYHRTVPAALKDEYVRQLMKFAGEKAGQFIRMCSEH